MTNVGISANMTPSKEHRGDLLAPLRLRRRTSFFVYMTAICIWGCMWYFPPRRAISVGNSERTLLKKPVSPETPVHLVESLARTSEKEKPTRFSSHPSDKNTSVFKIDESNWAGKEANQWVQPTNCPAPMLKHLNDGRDVGAVRSSNTDVAIAMIALGAAAKTTLVERSVQSIRRRGMHDGRVVVVTDAKEDRFGELRSSDGNVTVLHVEFDPTRGNGGPSPAMQAKRFKTQMFDLMDRDNSLDRYTHVVYIDIDVVVGDRLNPFFMYIDQMMPTLTGQTPPFESFMLMFEDQGQSPERKKNKGANNVVFHSGVAVLHREHSRQCLETWRELFDSGEFRRDQKALYHMLYEDGDLRRKCEVVQMDHRPFLQMPTKQSMREGKSSVFVHVTNTRRAKTIAGRLQHDYYRCTMMLDDTVAETTYFNLTF